MRLKTLEIKGFKSFADKTVLHFDKGVTGVIGPNGCGKSNIIDSIRWAIGEHKISALRSDKMSSLIFNGSKSRSASGLAEVSLTFENTRNILPTEFTTVTVNRKFFKNGDSEYRLNDVVCRLKDIHNLFLDTGISTDSYAIIELGMVDEIIKDKDNSRRRMLEQAAGISIYKTRKKEAKNKLTATEQDLSRIEDLLFEIEGNLKNLESQARKAERYYDLKKKYKAASIELAKASMEGFHDTFKQLAEQQQQEEGKKTRLDTDISRSDSEIETLKVQLVEKEEALQEMRRDFNAVVDDIRNSENDKKLAEQRLQYSQEQKQQVEDFLAGADERLAELQKSRDEGARQVAEQETRLADLTAELKALRKVRDERSQVYEEKKEKREQARRDQQRLQQHQFDVEKKTAVAETSIQNLQQSIARLEDENAAHQDEMTLLADSRAGLADTLAEEKEQFAQLQQQQEATRENILSTQSEIEELRTRLMDKTRTLDARKNEHDLLKSMVDNLEGYPESIKFLKKNPDWQTSAPVLSDVIFCQEAYRPAVEGLLEPYLNYYVVEGLEDALSAVQLLDKHKKGKANFFLLDHFNRAEAAVPQAEGDLVPALQVVEADEKYQGLAAHLLKNVFIAEDAAVHEAFIAAHPDCTIVEKSGRLNRSRYRLGGGATGLFEGNKLGRSKNLEKLKAVIKKMQQEADALQQQIEEKRHAVSGYNDQLSEQKIEEGREKINQLQNQLFGLENKAENFKSLMASNENKLLEMRDTLDATHEQVAQQREELAAFSDNMEGLQKAIETAEVAFMEADRAYNETSNQFNELNLQCTRQQSQLQTVRQEVEFKESRLEELKQQMANSHTQLTKAGEAIAAAEARIKETETLLQERSFQREAAQQKLNESNQAFQDLKNKVGEMEKSLRLMQRSKSEVEDGLSGLREELNQLKLQLAGMKERLDVEFKINLDDILDEERSGEESIETLKMQTEKYKKRLDNMGEINPTAIEAFQEMKKRYDFISTQKNDLVNARDSLRATIQEVEDIANQKFLETFNQVKENFVKVFKTLFTEEDEADMQLSDPDNLAETGVQITAKPKGKRPTAITQLSGGEKTLTATALLFAIYLIKPAPFCILDEVDAPLDDANVGKFTNMIREFSENSQFIVVTHNKQTMAAVDVIYGVTMQEAGVSKLVPVDFRSLN